MITQELVDYVKTQIATGVAREKITADLLGQGGWTMEQISEAFEAVQQNAHTNNLASGISAVRVKKTKIWEKSIPKSNWIAAIISTGLFIFSVFGFGGGLSVFSDTDLGPFAMAMLATMVGFVLFMLLENLVFCKELKDRESSALDSWIMLLIGLRNVVVILSVIPFIQLLGIAALVFGGVPWLILYVILLYLRFKNSNTKKIIA